MSDCVLETGQHRAAKPYRCDHCGKSIDTGTRYLRRFEIWEGSPYTIRSHLDCWNAAQDLHTNRDLCSDEGVNLQFEDLEPEERAWLREDYPEVAERLFGKAEA